MLESKPVAQIEKSVNKWSLAFIIFWLLWAIGIVTTLLIAWSAYNTPVSALPVGDDIHLCAGWSNFSHCSFLQFYLSDPYSQSYSFGLPFIPIVLLLLGIIMLPFTIIKLMRIISKHNS
jgi:hypothetical protein